MHSIYHPEFKLGVLGGGQLGRMLIQKAPDFDVRVYILDGDPHAPCSKIAHDFINGDIKDYNTVYNFGKDKDVVTIEIEHVNVDALEQLQREGVKVYPQPAIIRMIQDKGNQKAFYAQHNIPTAEFRLVETGKEVQPEDLPIAQKLRTGGYDGRGVQLLRDADDLSKAFDAPSVLEQLIDFEKELSVIVARNEAGEVKSFPIVELEFNPEANLVEFLFAPANVSETIEHEAREIAERLINELEMVGLLAVEMFLTKDGKVLVNEIAPRTHNSGHQSIEGNVTSQFEQHLRAILGLPLGDTSITQASVMVNILGELGEAGKIKYEGFNEILSWPGVHPHIYGKTNVKPFRKMGHVTITADTLDEAKKIAHQVKNTLKAVAE